MTEQPTTQRKRRFGDRPDGWLVRDDDALHKIMPYLLRNRADAEAFVQESIDLTQLNAYLEQKNANHDGYKYSIFQVVCAAILKTVILRPKLNRFIQGRRVYERNNLSLAFVAKNQFSDDGGESLLMLRFQQDDNLETIHQAIDKHVHKVRDGDDDHTTDIINVVTKMPRWLLRIFIQILRFLDYYGRVPQALVYDEPNFASVFLSNFGSIKLNAGYHHLNNWGTNSLFLVIGEKHLAPYYSADGTVEMRDTLPIGVTLDERIADGYYYAKSVHLFKYLMEHPQLLEAPFSQEVNYE
ncbi:MAG: hypothetical protein Q4B96_02820 [Bacillota bacterium]|nr:hypothetical protein [Bacillota bacterium]